MTQFTNAQEYRTALTSEIDARAAFELAKSSENDSMQDTLKKLRASVDHDTIAQVLLSSNVDVQIINRAERINARMNVYALEKIANIARAQCSAATLNHYTLAILKTALALEANERALTHRDAVCACSLDVKHTDSQREKVIKTTRYAMHVALTTASTQSSSSVNALQACNVLTETSEKTYRVNREAHATIALCAKLELAI